MAIVILNRSAMSFSPYHMWLQDADQQLHLYSAKGKRDLPHEEQSKADKYYATIKEYDDYDTTEAIDSDVEALRRKQSISAIIAMSEWDVIRAARLRAKLGLRGQSEESAIAFRDKFIMKQLLREAGVRVADFALINSKADLLNFKRRVEAPVVVKPRRSAGSRGVAVLYRERDCIDFPVTDDLVAEEAVDYVNEYHVDGILVEGDIRLIWPSVYVGKPTEFSNNRLFGGVMLDPTNPLRCRLQEFATRALNALPRPATTTFHAEIFEKNDGELILNEIASRTGGLRVNDIIKPTFGYWLNREWSRSMAGLPIHEQASNIPKIPSGLAGYVMLRPLSGRLRSLPDQCSMSFIYDYRVSGRIGETYRLAQSSGETIATAVVTGQSENEVLSRMSLVHEWFYKELKVE